MNNQKAIVNIPIPYGTIPKHKKVSKTKTRIVHQKKVSAPYPFFSSPTSSSFLSFFNQLFQKDNQQEHVGFMPCATSFTSNTQTSPLDIIVPISTTPIDCCYTGKDDGYDNSSLSTSSGSSHSDWSLNSFDMDFIEDDIPDNITTTALSDILCEHYVQTKMQSTHPQDEMIDIPLETFRMFEAPSNQKNKDRWNCQSITSLLNEPKDWTLVETITSSKPDEKEQEKIIVIIKKKPRDIPKFHHTRDIRSNTAYLRMIVAEVNMMRAEKIVGPLRPRRVLPKRSDTFMHKPSPLKLTIV